MDDTVTIESRYDFEVTVRRLRSTLEQYGFTVFASIDQRTAAASVGLELQPTVVVVYGNPRGGTPPVVAAPDFAIELPLKVVVRQDRSGRVEVLYRPAVSLDGAHGLPPGMAARLSASEPLIAEAAGSTSGTSRRGAC